MPVFIIEELNFMGSNYPLNTELNRDYVAHPNLLHGDCPRNPAGENLCELNLKISVIVDRLIMLV